MSENLPEKLVRNRKKTNWAPGVSGNPAGRPKKIKTIPDILAKIGKLKVKDNDLLPDKIREKFDDKTTMFDAVLNMVYIYALQGQAWAVQFIAERTEGTAPKTVVLQSNRIFVGIEGLEENGLSEANQIETDPDPVAGPGSDG